MIQFRSRRRRARMLVYYFILLLHVSRISSHLAKEDDSGSLHNTQDELRRKRKHNASDAEAHLYQSEGSLCVVNDACYSEINLDEVLSEQFRLSQLAHNCRNLRDNCQARADQEDCTNATHMEYMHSYCPKSCHTCWNRTRIVDETTKHSDVLTTKHGVTRRIPVQNVTSWSKNAGTYNVYSQKSRKTSEKEAASSSQGAELNSELEFDRPPHPTMNVTALWTRKDEGRIIDGYGSDLGVPQLLFSGPLRNSILRNIQSAQSYFHDFIMIDNRYRVVREKCRNLNPYCAAWAVVGHCDSDDYYNFMSVQCAPFCETCADFHAESKCPIDYNVPHAWYPGDLNRMFERILQEQAENNNSNVTILSSPTTTNGPWVLQIDDFVSSEEADRLVELGAREGYKRSKDVGNESEDGVASEVVSSGRTSTNAWCEPSTCEFEQVPQQVVSRIESLTGIHRNYSEVFQLLRYEEGQFYKIHHDYIEIDRERIHGVRIITVFLYLNTVEEGGGTNFPYLNLTIMPKKGRAVIWPSVLDDHPHDKDVRTVHQALPVNKGIKYGANAWIRQRHFRVATYDMDC
ncbi:hypothetical protein MPSEU_000000500 [Mayamaea pseudoterrestris]|nr:hypothetical protein MPSEU_000000500 [Mayamaea pseudoterrestris]